MTGWSAADIPDQAGRIAVVTGANSGIGLVTAGELARHGARVVLACRSAERGRAAEALIRRKLPAAEVDFMPLDLADLGSVRTFAADFGERYGDRLDLLVNNAGVMALPYGRTADGFETQFGVNHLGHFALTGLLLPWLLTAPSSRIVSVSSGFHAIADLDHSDLNSERGRYRRWVAYGRSKTANLLFVHELARRLEAAGSGTTAAAAHPGYAATNLQTAGPRQEGRKSTERLMELANRVVAQSASSGALPTLYAATAPGVRPDDFIGPRFGMRGAPARSPRARWTLDDTSAARLWEASEHLTGVTYESSAAVR